MAAAHINRLVRKRHHGLPVVEGGMYLFNTYRYVCVTSTAGNKNLQISVICVVQLEGLGGGSVQHQQVPIPFHAV